MISSLHSISPSRRTLINLRVAFGVRKNACSLEGFMDPRIVPFLRLLRNQEAYALLFLLPSLKNDNIPMKIYPHLVNVFCFCSAQCLYPYISSREVNLTSQCEERPYSLIGTDSLILVSTTSPSMPSGVFESTVYHWIVLCRRESSRCKFTPLLCKATAALVPIYSPWLL